MTRVLAVIVTLLQIKISFLYHGYYRCLKMWFMLFTILKLWEFIRFGSSSCYLKHTYNYTHTYKTIAINKNGFNILITIYQHNFLCYHIFYFMCLKTLLWALAGVAQRIECWAANKRVTSSIPSQSTCLGCRPGPQ